MRWLVAAVRVNKKFLADSRIVQDFSGWSNAARMGRRHRRGGEIEDALEAGREAFDLGSDGGPTARGYL